MNTINKIHGSFKKSTTISETRKNKNKIVKSTIDLFFGINQKSDNQNKNKQLKLW
jgi:hypothetical protein